MHHWLLVCLALPFSMSSLRAEDWPAFRGPGGDGIVRQGSAPLEWGPNKNMAWKKAIPGKGWSSPVVVGGRIYLTSAVPAPEAGKDKALTLQALCLDADSGKTLWEKTIFTQPATAPRIHGKNSHASPTPLVQDGKLYVHFGQQGTACLDLDGKILWKNDTIHYGPVHGNGGSPIIVDDKLIFGCDGGEMTFIIALNRETGKIAWKTDREVKAGTSKFSFATPTLITVKNQKQIISPASGAVFAYDPETGKEIWRCRYGTGYSVIPKAVFGHGLVFVSSGYGAPILMAIRPDGKGDVTETHIAWQTKKGAPHTPSPLLLGDELYTVSDDGFASCFDARNGNVHWKERLVDSNFSSSPIAVDGKIYLQSEQGVGFVLKSGKEFKQLARNPLDEKSLASYAVVDGALYIRTEANLYRFQASKSVSSRP
jgi:outer membrane protein assembly factor BamB